MQHKKIKELLTKLCREDREISGIVVFDIENGKSLAATFTAGYVRKTIAIEQLIAKLEKNRVLKLDPCGPKNWAMYSFGKKIITTVRIRKDIFMSVEYMIEKSPSASIEDALEVALMINGLL